MEKEIVFGGSAGNPTHLSHLALIQALVSSERFDRAYWVLSGSRLNEHGKTNMADPEHRVNMAIHTVVDHLDRRGSATKFELDLSDVYGKNRPTIEWFEKLEERHGPEANIQFATGFDVFVPKKALGGKCDVETWVRSKELMMEKKFFIMFPIGFQDFDKLHYPEHYQKFFTEMGKARSSLIRRLIAEKKPYGHLVVPEVEKYIEENKLYR